MSKYDKHYQTESWDNHWLQQQQEMTRRKLFGWLRFASLTLVVVLLVWLLLLAI